MLIHPPHTTTPPTPPTRPIDPGDMHTLSGAWLRATRDGLGLSSQELADTLGAGLRTVQRWETTHAPAWAVTKLDQISRETLEWLDMLESETRPVGLFHDGWHALRDGTLIPASWWRTTVGHATIRNLSLPIEWADVDD